MNGNAFHIDIAQLIRENAQCIYLICELYLTHTTTNMALEAYATMPGATGINADHTITLCRQHVHTQLMFALVQE